MTSSLSLRIILGTSTISLVVGNFFLFTTLDLLLSNSGPFIAKLRTFSSCLTILHKDHTHSYLECFSTRNSWICSGFYSPVGSLFSWFRQTLETLRRIMREVKPFRAKFRTKSSLVAIFLKKSSLGVIYRSILIDSLNFTILQGK